MGENEAYLKRLKISERHEKIIKMKQIKLKISNESGERETKRSVRC